MQRDDSNRDGVILDEALQILRAHLPELQHSYGVKSLGIFGSVVRGEQGERSDFDILVEFTSPPHSSSLSKWKIISVSSLELGLISS